jgi:folate-binding protein YgfZ
MPTVRLDDRQVLAVSGKDAPGFLQGLVSSDVRHLTPEAPLYAALLTPQGKIAFDFLMFSTGENGFFLDVTASKATDLLAQLKKYRLRAAVDLAERPDLAVFAAWGSEATGHPTDPRHPQLGARWIGTGDAPSDAAAYTRHRIALTVPDSADIEGQFPLDVNFEELKGVDFKKGCFVGQEVTARMKHKGQTRKRLVRVRAAPLPAFGSEITDATALTIGEMRSGIDGEGLAIMRLDRLETASLPLMAAGVTVTT